MPYGITGLLAGDHSPGPCSLIARTEKVYEVPFVSPEMTHPGGAQFAGVGTLGEVRTS